MNPGLKPSDSNIISELLYNELAKLDVYIIIYLFIIIIIII